MIVPTLDGYISDPFGFSVAPSFAAPKIVKAVKRLLSFRSRFFPFRKNAANGLIDTLIENAGFSPFGLCVEKSEKPFSYMIDGGDIHISIGLFKRTSPKAFFSVLLHEIAHVYIGYEETYKDLKRLDKEFLYKYGDVLSDATCSPVEVYARIAALSVLNELLKLPDCAKIRKKILFCVDQEQNKIKNIKKRIDELTNI